MNRISRCQSRRLHCGQELSKIEQGDFKKIKSKIHFQYVDSMMIFNYWPQNVSVGCVKKVILQDSFNTKLPFQDTKYVEWLEFTLGSSFDAIILKSYTRLKKSVIQKLFLQEVSSSVLNLPYRRT